MSHRNTVKFACGGHSRAVVSNHDELAFLAEFLDHIGIALAVGLVERGVGFVQNEERRGIHLRH